MSEVKERIKLKARELFMRYGLRSVTMDEIALQLGMSKKTIYQFYADKDELVDDVICDKIQCSEDMCLHDRQIAKNPIHETFLVIEMMQELFENMHPSILSELEKFYPVTYKKFYQYKYNFIYREIIDNIKRGIAAGLFRDDFDIEVMVRLRLETMMISFNQQIFPATRFSLFEVTREITESFLLGIATLRGHRLITKYKKDRLKKDKDGTKN